MKLLGIMGSSRRDGNTNDLLDVALKGASEAGAQVDKVVLLDYKIHHILNCKDCEQRGGCPDDEYPILRDKIFAAEGLIWASPVYWYTVSGLTKVLLDRLCCTLYRESSEFFLTKMGYKAAAVIATLEEGVDAAQPMLDTMKMVFGYEYCRWVNLGSVVGRGGSRGTALQDEDLVRRVRELGQRFARHGASGR
jgi:multimeric flavodoxin WrbA